jgi:hypothetical protein
MPVDDIRRFIGQKCEMVGCENYATHQYGALFICCLCHGGEVYTPDEAKAKHLALMAEQQKGKKQKAHEKYPGESIRYYANGVEIRREIAVRTYGTGRVRKAELALTYRWDISSVEVSSATLPTLSLRREIRYPLEA